MSWVRIWIHLVFSTKNKSPFLTTKELRNEIFSHIRENAREKGIWLDSVNGHKEHIHCLISLGREQTISKISQLIKGESSYWINKNKSTPQKFAWQDDFWAVSVSESHVQTVRKYIENQEQHHRKKSFTEEVEEFMKKYGWSYISGKLDES
ncbi:IS200/IS605 family transposase [Mariniphaga sp.]|uniref:IS200/IS605 family transposase n=1 Tax=Mariniphaga sp. TaxID=1954475 RepID=UPI00356704B1